MVLTLICNIGILEFNLVALKQMGNLRQKSGITCYVFFIYLFSLKDRGSEERHATCFRKIAVAIVLQSLKQVCMREN